MSTRVYKNKTATKGGFNTNNWGEPKRAQPLEKDRKRAGVFSAMIVMVMLTLTVAFTAIMLTGEDGITPPPGDGVQTAPVFGLPMAGEFEITRHYDGGRLQWNETAQHYTGFRAINIQAPIGTDILATYAGTIQEVTTSQTMGTIVRIAHSHGFVTTYSGLDPNVPVRQGDHVNKGQVIGQFGSTLISEAKDGPTLRIEMTRNGQRVNPADFIAFGNK